MHKLRNQGTWATQTPMLIDNVTLGELLKFSRLQFFMQGLMMPTYSLRSF